MIPLSILLPFFSLIAIGVVLGRNVMARPEAQAGLRAFVLWAALPAFLFRLTFRAAVPTPELLPLLAAYVGGTLGTATIIFLAAPGARRVAAAAAFNPNSGYIGVPAVLASPFALADPVVGTATVMLFVADQLTIVSLTTVLLMGRSPLAALRALIQSPLLAAIATAVLLRGVGIAELPAPLARLVDMLAAGAVPAALVALGSALAATTSMAHLRAGLHGTWPAIPGKLLLQPALVLLAARLLVGPSAPAAAAVLLAACPVSLNFFLIATAGGHDPKVIALLPATTTALALPTIALWGELLRP